MTIKVTVAPKGMGLNDFVAMRDGLFAEEGLDVEFDMNIFRGTQRSWKGLKYFERPQDTPFAEGRSVIQGACAWGSICNASAGMGKFVPDCYGVSPWGIFVRPDSKLRKPEDLKDVPIAVGMRAGSHFNVPYRLEKYLPLENIKPLNVGGFGARLTALLKGEVEAASLLPPQIDMARQLGMRPIVEDTFHTLWWVPEDMPRYALTKYFAALNRAERALQADLPRYLPLWELSIPTEFQATNWDFGKFTRGEQFIYEPVPKSEFEEVMRQVERWGLDQHLRERDFANLVSSVAA